MHVIESIRLQGWGNSCLGHRSVLKNNVCGLLRNSNWTTERFSPQCKCFANYLEHSFESLLNGTHSEGQMIWIYCTFIKRMKGKFRLPFIRTCHNLLNKRKFTEGNFTYLNEEKQHHARLYWCFFYFTWNAKYKWELS